MVKRKRAVEVDEDLMVKTMVESLHNDLLREFKRNQQQPVNFYEFVCHPTSFANTVENIFHVSFLIKERKIAMVDSEDSSLPELIPVSESGSHGHVASKDIGNDQRVVNINMRQWRAFVKIFDIKEGKEMVKRKANGGGDNGYGESSEEESEDTD